MKWSLLIHLQKLSLRNTLLIQITSLVYFTYNTDVKSTLPLLDFSEEVVFKKLVKLKTLSSPSPDSLPLFALRSCGKNLSFIMSLYFSTAKLPTARKLSIVKPIYKKRYTFTPSNYRPINLTCVVLKVIESIIIVDNLKEQVNSNNLFPSQHRFQASRSIEANISHGSILVFYLRLW